VEAGAGGVRRSSNWRGRESAAWWGQHRLSTLSRGVRSEDDVVADMWALGPDLLCFSKAPTSKFTNMIFPMSKNGETF
jgi:hypothetical protein